MKVDIFNTDKKYNIIYADPPWSYSAGGKVRNAKRHYPTMKPEEIYMVPVSNIAADNCILFLWATFPNLPQALETIKRWGFTYKTLGFVWVKRNIKSPGWFMGGGNWTRSNSEICLIGVKGRNKRVSASVRQVCDAPRMEHSRKPPEIRERIIELCGDLPRIELFARQHADGWDCWGNETEKFDEEAIV